MNLRQLEVFQAVMSTGSATAAATRLGLTQSAVSRTLAKLEHDVGLRLFTRDKGRLAETAEAQALLQDAQRLLESAQGLRRHAEQLRRGGFRRKLLRIALPDVVASNLLPGLASRFMERYPDVVLEVLSGGYADAERALLSKEADVGLLQLPVHLPGIEMFAHIEADAVCVLPRGHALTREAQVTPAMLAQYQLVLLGRHGRNRQEVELAFRRARLPMRIAVEARSVGVACSFLASGVGVGVLNALVAGCCRSLPLEFRPFVPKLSFAHGLALGVDTPAAPLARAFCAVLAPALLRQSQDLGTRLKDVQ